jgi:hypothetical protein
MIAVTPIETDVCAKFIAPVSGYFAMHKDLKGTRPAARRKVQYSEKRNLLPQVSANFIPLSVTWCCVTSAFPPIATK